MKPKNLNNGKCYQHLPVTTLNREFTSQSTTNSTLFLSPHSRIITYVSIEIPCSDKFITKFKTFTGNFISYTDVDAQDNIPPKRFFWNENIKINFKTSSNYSFNNDKGNYNIDTIKEFDEIQMLSGKTESILSNIVRNIAKKDQR